ncbi:MAG: aminotransferase class IV [Polyangia bacterium]
MFLFHKTTNRSPYERAWSDRTASDDVVLWNERSEITETTSCNIVAEIGGRMITPARSCGLLAGTFRRMLLDRKEIAEGVITRERLAEARRLWVINSVRGMRPAMLL